MKKLVRARMLQEIFCQGEHVSESWPRLVHEARLVAASLRSQPVRTVLVVGCGDSYTAARATRIAFHRWSDVWAEALEAFEAPDLLARAPSDALVVAVTVSGRSSRTLEALREARRLGLRTVGITSHPEGPTGALADQCIRLPPKESGPGPVPHTLVQTAALGGLYALAGALGEDRFGGDACRQTWDRDVLRALGGIRETAQRNQGPIADYVARLLPPEPLIIVGAGPLEAVARFAAAKLAEAAQVPAVPQQLEEWTHEQYYLTGPHRQTILIGTEGRAWHRLQRVATAIDHLGGTLVAVVPEGAHLDCTPQQTWRYQADLPEEVTPILAKVPLELLAYQIAEKWDRSPFDRENPSRQDLISEKE